MMTYDRVIPRDLFNEANLLKCLGRIYINLERLNMPRVELLHDGAPFRIEQDESDGGLIVSNVVLIVRGQCCRLQRPLNSRDEWPLYLTTQHDDEISVFADDGNFSPDMRKFLEESE